VACPYLTLRSRFASMLQSCGVEKRVYQTRASDVSGSVIRDGYLTFYKVGPLAISIARWSHLRHSKITLRWPHSARVSSRSHSPTVSDKTKS